MKGGERLLCFFLILLGFGTVRFSSDTLLSLSPSGRMTGMRITVTVFFKIMFLEVLEMLVFQ